MALRCRVQHFTTEPLCSVPIDQTSILSYDVASERKITSCNKIDKSLVVCRYTRNVMMYVTSLGI